MIKTEIISITSGPRQTNIEILRIVAMFLVLVVHASFWATGAPNVIDFESSPISSFTKTFFESISIVCVNVFILISGWFGIKPSIKGFSSFIFQCLFFLIGIYIIFLITGLTTLSLKGIAGCLCLTSANWFIRAYIALYILSPVLNYFVTKASKRVYKNVLTAFFIFQTIFGWSGAARFIEMGYSCFSFIGLYLLARYLKIYGSSLLTSCGGGIYIISIIINTFLYYVFTTIGFPIDIYAYVNPLVILGALGLIMYFSKLKIKSNKFINWIARSSFAVFLLHSNPNIGVPIFKKYILKIYYGYSGIECITYIFLFLLFIFIIAIILDQPRKFVWKLLFKKSEIIRFKEEG